MVQAVHGWGGGLLASSGRNSASQAHCSSCEHTALNLVKSHVPAHLSNYNYIFSLLRGRPRHCRVRLVPRSQRWPWFSCMSLFPAAGDGKNSSYCTQNRCIYGFMLQTHGTAERSSATRGFGKAFPPAQRLSHLSCHGRDQGAVA